MSTLARLPRAPALGAPPRCGAFTAAPSRPSASPRRHRALGTRHTNRYEILKKRTTRRLKLATRSDPWGRSKSQPNPQRSPTTDPPRTGAPPSAHPSPVRTTSTQGALLLSAHVRVGGARFGYPGVMSDPRVPSLRELLHRLTRRAASYVHGCSSSDEILRGLGEVEAAPTLATLEVVVLLREAAHQADLLMQPYVSEAHLRLAAAWFCGNRRWWESLRSANLEPWTTPRSRWLPRGRLSAARPAAQERLAAAHIHAVERESERHWPT